MSWSSSENFVSLDETPGLSISKTRQVQLRHLGWSSSDAGLLQFGQWSGFVQILVRSGYDTGWV